MVVAVGAVPNKRRNIDDTIEQYSLYTFVKNCLWVLLKVLSSFFLSHWSYL